MGCMTLNGISGDLCTESRGGIKAIQIIEKKGLDIDGMTVVDGEITNLDILTGYTLSDYSFLKNNASWGEKSIGDGISSSISFGPKVNLTFRRMSKELRNEVMELSKGTVVIFVTDANNITWVLGTYAGLTLSASGGSQSGMKLDELNGEVLEFTGEETYKAYVIDPSAINAV